MPAAVDTPSVASHTVSIPRKGLHLTCLETSTKILDIIDRYRLKRRLDAATRDDEGTLKFLALIYSFVKAEETVRLCLPAFPFKSPNHQSKVLGRLPDTAEAFALAHLNGLCAAIGDVYKPGAKLVIISDGLVYNDLLGVADKDVWSYGEAIRSLVAERRFQHLEFSRLKDLVDVNVPNELDEMVYVANASNFRRALLNRFARPDWDSSLEISGNEDTCLTYRGYIKFLETDLRHVYPVTDARSKTKYKKGIEYIAKQMLMRGDAFARAVREKFSKYVRLSIHPSTGEAKLSISLLPTDSLYTTPWHCSVAFRLDGTVMTGHRADFESNPEFELVTENGRPMHFREKTDLLSWGEKSITCEPLYPSGLLIRPATTLLMGDIDSQKVRALAELNSPVVLRGFSNTQDRDLFVQKAHDFGTPLPWKFGLVLEVKDRGADTRGLNNVLSAEWMPFHFDGLFKTEKHIQEDGAEKLVSVPPKFQMFTAVTPSPPDTGYTLFSPSHLLFRHLRDDISVDYLSSLTWSVSTGAFDSTVMGGMPLVVPHPTTGKPCLRYHEPWPQTKTKFDPTRVTIDTVEQESNRICDALDSLLHDRRIAYYHSWEQGDLLISDNILTMHTRSDFTAGCERELWRIHFD